MRHWHGAWWATEALANLTLALCVVFAVVTWSGLAIGGEPAPAPRVVIVGDDGTQRMAKLLAEDLHAHGFEVARSAPQPGDDRESTSGATLRLGAVAALRIKNRGQLIEVWVSGSADRPARMRETVAPFDGSDEARADAVVRAVELMRASLIEIRRKEGTEPPAEPKLANPVPGAPAPPPPDRLLSAETVTARRKYVSVAAGFGPVLASGGSTASMGVPLEIRIALRKTWGLGLRGMVPTRSGWLAGPEATARISPVFLGAAAWVTPWVGGVLVPYFGANWSMAILRMSSQTNPGYTARSGTAVASVTAASAGVSVRINEVLGLRLEGWAGAALPRTDIQFAGHDAGTWGPLVGAGSLSVEGWL